MFTIPTGLTIGGKQVLRLTEFTLLLELLSFFKQLLNFTPGMLHSYFCREHGRRVRKELLRLFPVRQLPFESQLFQFLPGHKLTTVLPKRIGNSLNGRDSSMTVDFNF